MAAETGVFLGCSHSIACLEGGVERLSTSQDTPFWICCCALDGLVGMALGLGLYIHMRFVR